MSPMEAAEGLKNYLVIIDVRTKSEWKEKVRDIKKEPAVNEDTGKTEMVTKKSNKMSKAAKRHSKKSK